MAKQLLSNFGKKGDSSYTTTGVAQGLDQIKVDIEDTAHLSKYFNVVEFNPVFTAGKNSISFNGSDFLQDGSEIKVEVLDSNGNSLYLAAPSRKSNYVDIANFTVAIYVYKETVDGAGKVILVGTTTKGEIVRWTGNITINTTYQNVSRVRFYNAPAMEARSLLYPVVQSITGSILTTDVTVTGSFWFNVETPHGFFSPESSNYGPSVPSNTTIVLWAFSGSSNTYVDAFNSQMEGQIISLTYDYVNTQTKTTPPVYKHVNTTATINKVRSTTTVEISSIPLGPVAQLSPSGGLFNLTYPHVTYIPQGITTPCTATWITNTPQISTSGYMEVHANTDIVTASMVGQTIIINYGAVQVSDPYIPQFNPAIITSRNRVPQTGSSFPIQAVTGSRIIHTPPTQYTLYFDIGNTPYTYNISKITGSITFLSGSGPYQEYVTAAGTASVMKKSYVDIVYRNLDAFSGCIARHKLYARSNIYPGNFELIDDTVLGPAEMLTDPITVNKSFSSLGKFANQDMINQYWFSSTASISLNYNDSPVLNSMVITPTPDYSAADGNPYVIVKTTAPGTANDAIYYPYNETEFNEFSGRGYASNFLFVAQNVLYVLSANVVVRKNKSDTAKVMFFLTSSIANIKDESSYTPPFGMKLGEIIVNDPVATRVFSDVQQFFFTPLNDYYGTLIIVPYLCEVTLTNVSLMNYGDYGFSPGCAVVQIPFPVNIANEKWTLKAELFDSNYNLVSSVAPIVQAFDPNGNSLFGSNILGSTGTTGIPTTLPQLTVTGQLYLPNLGQCNTPKRLAGYNIPQHYPPLPGEGSVCYTDVSELSLIPTNGNVSTKDYINVSTIENNVVYTGRAIAVRYSGSVPNVYGRRIYVDSTGTKHTYS